MLLAPLFFARNSIIVAIHFGVEAILQKVSHLFARGHVATVSSTVTIIRDGLVGFYGFAMGERGSVVIFCSKRFSVTGCCGDEK